MKAFILKDNGIDNLSLTEIPTPAPTSNAMLVKTMAVAINPVDITVITNEQVRKAMLKPVAGHPVINGWDIAGEIIETGDAVTEFKKGDRVFGCVNFPGQGSAFAENVVVPADQVAVIPYGISFETAAAACMAALTPWQALVTNGKITQKDKVLVHAAAGGVGHQAVQIAKSFGAYVIGTASAANIDFVFSLGADEVIDYKKDKFESLVKDADLILDSIDANNLSRSLEAVKEGGRIISLKAAFDGALADKAKQKNVKGIKMSVASNGADMKTIAGMLASGKLTPTIFKTFGFTDIPAALQAMHGVSRGKIIITL